MIRKFSVSNFGSFANGFNFSADPDDDGCNVSSAIFGTNGSGKSNFVNSIDFLKRTIMGGLEEDYLSHFNKDHELSDNILFEIEVDFADDHFFVYKLELDAHGGGIIGESLTSINCGVKRLLIQTKKTKRTVLSNPNLFSDSSSDNNKTVVECVYKSLTPDYFFGKKDLGSVVLGRIYLFYSIIMGITIVFPYSSILAVIDPDNTVRLIRSMDSTCAVKVDRITDTERKKEIRKTINNPVGPVHRTSCVMDHITGEIFYYSIRGGREDCFKFTNNSPGDNMHYSFSEGQKRMMELAPMITDESDYAIFIVDELDRKLHTNLSIQFVNLFMKKKKKQQLIFTTHEPELIDSDLISNDNMWIIERESGDGSYLYSFPSRMIDVDLKRMYIEDRLLEM